MTRNQLFLAALALSACTSRDTRLASVEVARPDQVLGGNIAPKSYDIPPGHAGEIRRLFKGGGAMGYPIAVVSEKGTNTQFVNPQPVFIGDNRFVVALPEGHHAALEQVLASIKTSGAAGVAESYEMTYWVILAKPADATTVAPELGEVKGTLDKLGALGPQAFTMVDRIGGRVTDGEDAEMHSVRTKIMQTMSTDNGTLQLHLEVEENGPADKHGGPYIKTTLRLKPDQPIVLGDSALSQPVALENGLVLYVVRARRVD